MAKGKFERWLSPDGLLLIAAWARDGLSEDQIARNCGVSRSTLNDWKNRFPDISDAIKKSGEVVDIEVENALLKRALGFEYNEVKVEKSPDGYKCTVTRKLVVPDVGAIALWLKNRRPDKWRDKPNVATVTLPDLEKDPLSAALEDTEC